MLFQVNELRVTVERYQRAGAPMADDMDDTVSLASSTRRPDTKYSSEQRRMEKERRETQEVLCKFTIHLISLASNVFLDVMYIN